MRLDWWTYSVVKRSGYFTLQASMFSDGEISTLNTFPVPPYKMHMVESIMAFDMDSVISTKIELGVMDGSVLTPFDSCRGPFTIGQSFNVTWPCLVPSCQCVYAQFVTPTENDRLKLVVRGHIIEVDADEA